jgi:CheY-like chemotaxis protein
MVLKLPLSSRYGMPTIVSSATTVSPGFNERSPTGILVGKVNPGPEGGVPTIDWLQANAVAADLLGVGRGALLAGIARLPPSLATRLEALCARVARPASAGGTRSSGHAEDAVDGLTLFATDLGDGCVLVMLGRSAVALPGSLDLVAAAQELREPARIVADTAEHLLDAGTGSGYAMAEIQAAAARLIGLIDDLHAAGMPAQGGPREDEEFAPSALVRDVVETFRGRAHDRGVTLAVQPFDSERRLLGDAGRIGRVLRRLMVDALDRAVGMISVGIAEEEAGEGSAGAVLRFEVGVPGPQMRTPTAIGIALAHRLAATMGGSAGVAALPDGGCTTWFTARLRHADEAEETGGLRVLLAEDNEITRRLVAVVLQRQGHHVTAVDNGRKAVAEVASRRFDVVLMDMHMPELDGNEATRLIRALQRGGERLPVIALTADALPEQRARHLSTDLDAYLTKPVDWNQLDHVMRTLAARDGRAELSSLDAASS